MGNHFMSEGLESKSVAIYELIWGGLIFQRVLCDTDQGSPFEVFVYLSLRISVDQSVLEFTTQLKLASTL